MTRSARRALSALTTLVLVGTLCVGAPAPVRALPQTVYVGHEVNDYALGSECADPHYWTDGDWTGGGVYDSDNDAIQDAADNAASGSVIYICAGTYVFAEEVTVGAGKNITFRGQGDATVLDGNDATRIFNSNASHSYDQGGVLSLRDLLIMDAKITSWNGGAVESDGLSLDNVTITGSAGAYNGGALYAEGNVTIVDSTLTDNIAITDGVALYAWNGERTVSINNSVFDGNTTTGCCGSGGAILAATISVTNSTFSGNSAYNGGAISATTATVTGSTFTGNHAYYGGAVQASTVSTTNSSFTENYAFQYGGAITTTTATVTGSTFTHNSADNGGAIIATTATVTSSTLTSNVATFGGAISATTTTVTSSTFTDNDAIVFGGAISSSTATIARSRFTRNTAGEHGGAVVLWEPTSADLRQVRGNTFMRNTAPAGGAITLGFCVAPSRSQAARVLGANRFSGNRATEQRRTQNIERWEGGCG